MKLSFQTVCIIFGVTLVHLIIIATLSPMGSEGERLFGPVPDLVVGEGPAEETIDADGTESQPIHDGRSSHLAPRPDAAPPTPVELPVDLPARRREEAAAPVTPPADPVAATRPAPQAPRS